MKDSSGLLGFGASVRSACTAFMICGTEVTHLATQGKKTKKADGNLGIEHLAVVL
jgi:hypothetical protein